MKRKGKRKVVDKKNGQKYVDLSCLETDRIFDLAIKACDTKDALKACNVIDTLKGLLNFQYKEVACGFYRLFDCCLQFVNDKRFDKARDIFYELHQSWNVAFVTNSNHIQDPDISLIKKVAIKQKG